MKQENELKKLLFWQKEQIYLQSLLFDKVSLAHKVISCLPSTFEDDKMIREGNIEIVLDSLKLILYADSREELDKVLKSIMNDDISFDVSRRTFVRNFSDKTSEIYATLKKFKQPQEEVAKKIIDMLNNLSKNSFHDVAKKLMNIIYDDEIQDPDDQLSKLLE